ncbi:hypothetical protein I547_7342 [Mycobacterium kansasii 824]|nr:hypothetical protein I547_7342 [Mycobacterium kansasii 824]
MIASHTRALAKARNLGEPAGQLAARELELDRLRSALRPRRGTSRRRCDCARIGLLIQAPTSRRPP